MPSLLEARRAHQTQLRVRGPSPQPHRELGASLAHTLARRVCYRSEGRELAALYHPPAERTEGSLAPGLLYLHGGWALEDRHVLECRPFLDAGFAVFAPSYRGENGNPGTHEMLWGELDDARAALEWLARAPGVDAQRLFVFGHSAGGMLAMLMAFDDPSPAFLAGSIAGIYGPEIFDHQRLPFVDSKRERELRLALPHIEGLRQPHIAFVGVEDMARSASDEAGRRSRAAGAPLEVIYVPGDHSTSVAHAQLAFLSCAQRVILSS